MAGTPNQQAFEAVMNGTLEDVRNALAQGANPSAFRGTKCLLVRALEHPDPEEATARARLLLESGAAWNPKGVYTPWRQVFTRRLTSLLPAFGKYPEAFAPAGDNRETLPAGWAAQCQWSDGLRALHAMGKDVRYSETVPFRNPSFTSTLETWFSFSIHKPPKDLEQWLSTAQWLMGMPLPDAQMPQARQGVINALERAPKKNPPHLKAFLDLLEANPTWFDDTSARVVVSNKLRNMEHAKTPKTFNGLWQSAVELTERRGLSLSPGDTDHHFKESPLECLLKLTVKHKDQPKLFKQALDRVRWALEHGATLEDHNRGRPAWYHALAQKPLPYQALQPLLERGLDLTKPVRFTRHPYLLENELKRIDQEEGNTAAELLLHANQESFEELVRALPAVRNQRDKHGKTLLMQLADREFRYTKGRLARAYESVLLLQSLGASVDETDGEGNTFLSLLMKNDQIESDDAIAVIMHIHATAPGVLTQPNHQGTTALDLIRKRYANFENLKPFWNAVDLNARLPAAATANPAEKRRF